MLSATVPRSATPVVRARRVAASLGTIILGSNVIAQRPQALRQSAQLVRSTVDGYRLLLRPEDLPEGVQRLVDVRTGVVDAAEHHFAGKRHCQAWSHDSVCSLISTRFRLVGNGCAPGWNSWWIR
jgi:hypothetical protein